MLDHVFNVIMSFNFIPTVSIVINQGYGGSSSSIFCFEPLGNSTLIPVDVGCTFKLATDNFLAPLFSLIITLRLYVLVVDKLLTVNFK